MSHLNLVYHLLKQTQERFNNWQTRRSPLVELGSPSSWLVQSDRLPRRHQLDLATLYSRAPTSKTEPLQSCSRTGYSGTNDAQANAMSAQYFLTHVTGSDFYAYST
jgi:hypothetical protein